MSETIEKDPHYSENNLIWLDMEMTGLQPEVNRIIEIASVITDAQLKFSPKVRLLPFISPKLS